MEYCGSNLWHSVAKKSLMDKYKCSELLVLVPPKSPVEVYQLLKEADPHRSFLGVVVPRHENVLDLCYCSPEGSGLFPETMCVSR